MRTWLKALCVALLAEAGLVCLLVVALGDSVPPVTRPALSAPSQALTVRVFHAARIVHPNLDVNRAPAVRASSRARPVEKKVVADAVEPVAVAAPPSVTSRPSEVEKGSGAELDQGSPEVTAAHGRDVLAAYSAELFDRIAQKRGYLRIFRQKMTGVAEVELAVDREGRLLSVELKKSAGYFQLDQQALQMVREAAPFSPLPSGYSDLLARFSLPISFGQ